MKKKYNSKIKTKKTIFRIFIVIIIVAIISLLGYSFLTAEDEKSTLTLLEKQWIEKNKINLIDIDVPNNLAILSDSGSGVIFDFLDYFEQTTELKFNKKPYNYIDNNIDTSIAIKILRNDEKIKKEDILIKEDNYVVVGNEESNINDIRELNGKTVGILSSDSGIISNYFDSYSVNLSDYNDINSLLDALKSGVVSYAIMPKYAYLNNIIEKQVFINFSIDDLSNKIVLRLGDNNKLNNILSKCLNKWIEEKYEESYYENLLNLYKTNKTLTEVNKNNLTNRIYTYGYIASSAYSIVKNDNLYGVAGEYINTLKDMLGMEFEYVKYEKESDLEKDLKTGYLDIAFLTYDYKSKDYISTSSPFIEQLSVLSSNYKFLDKKQALINNKLYLFSNGYLSSYINKLNAYVKNVNNYSSDYTDGLLVLDKNEYLYNINKLSNYNLLFNDTFNGNYHFIVKSDNEKLADILNFVLENSNYNDYETKAINNLRTASDSENNFQEIYLIVLAIIFLPIIVILLVIVVINKSKKLKINKKENILKYNDVLTNLKNRNYLNDNIDKWDDTKIYPRTIIIIDLNNLKYVNDNYGHEEGNELIKKAAAILINTQLEKSDIVRTDGNEFLIYLISYSKNQVDTYISKLSKEFEKLPYGFGAAIGYSIINDEIKTIDDAINEATIEMRMDKEQNYR